MLPFWGMGEVTGFSQATVLGEECEFCHIRPLRLDHPIRFPQAELSTMGIRPLLSGRQMTEIVFLSSGETAASQEPGSQDYEEWVSLLRSGRPGARAFILRQMAQSVSIGRRLRPRENELRLTIRQNFRDEIRAVFRCSRQQAAALARKALA